MSCPNVARELACRPGAIPAAERQAHFALARELFHERTEERAALPNGYAIRFAPDALATYKWIFIGLAGALLGYGFYAAYWRPRRTCAAGAACEVCGTGRSVRAGLWIATIVAIGAIVFEQVEPYLDR